MSQYLWERDSSVKFFEIIGDSQKPLFNLFAPSNGEDYDLIKSRPVLQKCFESCLDGFPSATLQIPQIQAIDLVAKKIILNGYNEQGVKKFDDRLCTNDVAKAKIRDIFPGLNIEYEVIMLPSRKPDQGENRLEKNKNTPKKIWAVRPPVALPIDRSKTFENLYTLESKKIQWILELLNAGKHIALTGVSGSGKTHFTQAIANELGSKIHVVYTTWDNFCHKYWNHVRWLIEAKNNQANAQWKSFEEQFNTIDLLIIDDIEALWGKGKSSTQYLLQKIVRRHPEMRLIITSKIPFKDIPWMKKTPTEDGPSGSEVSSIFEEIRNLNLIMTTKPEEDISRKVAQTQWELFLQRKGDMFLPKQLPAEILDLLSRRVNQSFYEQIFEAIRMECRDFSYSSYESIFDIIHNFVSKKIKPDPEEIIDVIIDSLLEEGSELGWLMGLKTKGIDVSLYDKKEIRQRLNGAVSFRKSNSLESIVLRLCVYFIRQYLNIPFADIWGCFNGKTTCNAIFKDTADRLTDPNAQRIREIIFSKIQDFLNRAYGIK